MGLLASNARLPEAVTDPGLLTHCRAVAALAEDPEFHFAQTLEPGTIEWIHNPSIMHSRSEVVDGEVRRRRPFPSYRAQFAVFTHDLCRFLCLPASDVPHVTLK